MYGAIIIRLFAPADTENVPILSERVRKKKRILSYLFFAVGLTVATIIKDNTISNMIIFGYFFQTCMITKLAYKLTNNKYGYEVYKETST